MLFFVKNYSKYVQRLILLVKVKLQKNKVVIYELCNKFHSTSPNRFSIFPTKLVFHTHNGQNIFFVKLRVITFFHASVKVRWHSGTKNSEFLKDFWMYIFLPDVLLSETACGISPLLYKNDLSYKKSPNSSFWYDFHYLQFTSYKKCT